MTADVKVGDVTKRAAERAISPHLMHCLDNLDGICDTYVVFVDIVDYTKRTRTQHQAELVKVFQRLFDVALTATAREFHGRLPEGQADLLRDVIIIPLGDGMAVAFPFPALLDLPLYFAKRLFEEVHKNNHECDIFMTKHWCDCHENMMLRCGISFGGGVVFRDVNNRLNLAGKPINLASRLMGVAEPCQIFICENFYSRLYQLVRYKDKFRPYEAEVKHKDVIKAYQFCESYPFVDATPRTDLEEAAAQRVAVIRTSAAASPIGEPPPKTSAVPETQLILPNSPNGVGQLILDLERRLVPVPAGSFFMGNTKSGHFKATFTRPFLVDCVPVTRSLYQAIASRKTRVLRGEELPVEGVTWRDAVDFCIALSRFAGRTPVYSLQGSEVLMDLSQNGYRLPTEAEWEYCAVRDETIYGNAAIEDMAWCQANAQGRSQPVGRKQRGDSPLSDLLGNVWEWCWDWYAPYPSTDQCDYAGPPSGRSRVLRGGDWGEQASVISPRKRHWTTPVTQKNGIGFRVVRNQDIQT